MSQSKISASDKCNSIMSRDASRTRVLRVLWSSFTRSEIEAARILLREHLRRFPEDCQNDIAHGFHHIVDMMEEREKEAEAMRLTPQEHEEREAFFKYLRDNRVVDAGIDDDAPLVLAYHQSLLEEWLRRFPGDPCAHRRLEYVENEREYHYLARDLMNQLRCKEAGS